MERKEQGRDVREGQLKGDGKKNRQRGVCYTVAIDRRIHNSEAA